ncbi:MAG: sigma 54-dependent Fis family transcriptional regulator [Sandaracinaceae bacterium]|nr:sigma 54-dependent Fis family transcriptional regulator [Sandaracinaceae bacterium]
MTDRTLTASLSIATVDLEVATVTVVDGPDRGLSTAITDAALVLGSSEKADLRLNDRTISRMHCELSREGQAVRIRDLGSKNGIWLAGSRIEAAVLAPGAHVHVGGTELEVGLDRRRTQQYRWTGPDELGDLLGASRAMHQLFATLERVAPANMHVLVHGESGTGKELVARALHAGSPRFGGPLVVVDGAALSRSLADSELFGHVRGAFTDARQDHEGAFERAHGGTVFLDEIGELPLEVQAKLLRVVQEGHVRRLGDTADRKVDVRVVAATHKDLRLAVNEGTFREDLFYRLAGVLVEVPPLRMRSGDVELLGKAFAKRLAPDDPRAEAMATAALATVSGYRWPGNVRELRSFIQRSLLLGDARLGAPARMLDGPARIRTDLPFVQARREWVEAFEKQYLSFVLDQADGNVSEAARRSGLARSSFYELMTKLEL